MSIDNLKNDVENWINEYFNNYIKDSSNKEIYESMFYSLKIGGKRIRPVLTLLSYKLFKHDYNSVLPVACALEMIHTYSLIHDDLPCMDNDDLRRGSPTNHKVFGEALAVLAGDALLNEAMNVLFRFCQDGNLNKIKASLIISQASSAEGMIGGQVIDILSENTRIDKETLYLMHKKKTGALIKASILSGAVLGGAYEEDLIVLNEYGEKLGLAFQIKDDILDVIGDTDILGKKTNSDECNEKSTFITAYGLDVCVKMCENLIDDCIKLLKSLNKDTIYLEELTLFLLQREY
jgi:geranylgeranyl diphosphate synthase, type II